MILRTDRGGEYSSIFQVKQGAISAAKANNLSE